MKNIKFLSLVLIFLFIVIVLIANNFNKFENFNDNQIKSDSVVISDGHVIYVTLAENKDEWAKGLMHVEKLEDDYGMFFIFNDDEVRNFWMKDTLIALDMIFIDSEFKIINIVHDARPCINESCEIHSSIFPARYVLEVNSGFCVKNNVSINDSLRLVRKG